MANSGVENGGGVKMIRLYRHDGLEILLNLDLIRQVEATPDTVITLLSGEKIKVKNTIADVTTKIKAARQGSYEENRDREEDSEMNKRPRKFIRR
jgi:flagellar protein FlbD